MVYIRDKIKKKLYDKNWHEANKERIALYRKQKYTQGNVKEQLKAWKNKNREKVNGYSRKYRASLVGKQANHKYYLENTKWLNSLNTKNHKDVRLGVLSTYCNGSPCCQCCGETGFEFLTIDHVAGDGAEHRKRVKGNIYYWLRKNNYPAGFQVLCMNCNWAKGTGLDCPHKRNKLSKMSSALDDSSDILKQ